MPPLKCDWNRLLWVRTGKRVATILLVIFAFDVLLFPLPSIAEMESVVVTATSKYISKTTKKDNKRVDEQDKGQVKRLPSTRDVEVKSSFDFAVTAYSSSADECQGDPCITANGFNLCKHNQEDTIATNRFPLGTKVKIPDLYNDKVFVVRDRMNKRYYNRVDIWMKTKEKAKQFGVKRNVKLVVVE